MEVENNIPKGWMETTLEKVASKIIDYRGKTPKKLGGDWDLNGNYRALSAKSVKTGGLINLDQIKRVDHSLYKKWMKDEIQFNDILLTSEAPMGEVLLWKSHEKIVLSQRLFAIRAKENISPNYLYYYFISKTFQHELNARSSGTTVLGIRQTELVKTNVIIPTLPEQKAIAKVLTAFDDKIELLHEQNKTLESMAQTIFKEWFGKYQIGDDLPEGWRVGVIGDLIEIKRGGSPRPIKDYISDSGYRWLKISDASATSSPYIFIIKEHIKKEGLKKTTLKHKGDLVLSNSATPGIPKFLAVDTCVHDGWMHFSNAKVSNEYLYLLFLNIRPKLLQQGSGSVFVNLKTDTLRQFETIIASKNDFETFDNLIKPIFTKIYNNALQIQSLTKTKDTLSPKLMSGQVRVNNIKQTADA